MTNQELLTLILSDNQAITLAISTGAQWEIWMQAEFEILCRKIGWEIARKVRYPYPHQGSKLDFLVKDNQGQYAIELKVESATNAGQIAGQSIPISIENDKSKIQHYRQQNSITL